MTGRLTIDNVDVWTTYGAWLSDQGVNELLSWPESKAIDTVSWAENDGVEADLSDLKLAAREFNITFYMRNHPTDVNAFYKFLAGSIYRTWSIASLGRSYTLRYVNTPTLTASATKQQFAVRVALDEPLSGYSYVAPVSHIAAAHDYALDGVLLSDYGVRALSGTLDSTARPATVKGALKRDISTINGVLYDGDATNREKESEITLQCALIDPTLSGAWKNYDALLYDLVKKDNTVTYDTDKCRRLLHSFRLKYDFDCYYKGQSVTGFYPDGGKVWLLFTLRLAVLGYDYAVELLASEDAEYVVTETNSYKIRI